MTAVLFPVPGVFQLHYIYSVERQKKKKKKKAVLPFFVLKLWVVLAFVAGFLMHGAGSHCQRSHLD